MRRWTPIGIAGIALVAWVGTSPVQAGSRLGDRELIAQLDREIIALKQHITMLEQRDCGSSAGPDPIYGELVQVFSTGTVKIERDGNTTLVTVPADQLFDTSSLRIRAESSAVFDLLALALSLHPEHRIQIISHTDSELPPTALRKLYPTNWELSAARAAAVARVLIDAHQIAPARLTVTGRAELEPVTNNDTPEGRGTNRRIVFEIKP